MTESPEPGFHTTIVVGSSTLALRVCEELTSAIDERTTVIWHGKPGFRPRIEACGARYVTYDADDERGLLDAAVRSADAIVTLTEDDQFNLRIALKARDLNPTIRLVLRQFNRRLGRKIAQRLDNCSVASLSSLSAATYACAAVDPACSYGVRFPDDIDGALFGLRQVTATAAGVAGLTVPAAERRIDGRIVAVDDDLAWPTDAPLAADAMLTSFGAIRAARPRVQAANAGVRTTVRRRARIDPVVRNAVVVAALTFAGSAIFFARALHLDAVAAIYFVMETMTTTGFGDITPSRTDRLGQIVAIVLMLSGITFSGIFIAILTTSFTQARLRATQGLRRLRTRGHVIVCGAGTVGSRVIDDLLALGARVVVVERDPTADIVARARDGAFELLTGDATREETLDHGNVAAAAALVTLIDDDTKNLEVALGARTRNDELPIVMRSQGGAFAQSVRRHFGFERAFGTAALAAPVFAGLARNPGVRGRMTIGSREYAVVEIVRSNATHETDVLRTTAGHAADGTVLVVRRGDAFVRLDDFASTEPGDVVLTLFPLWRWQRSSVGR